MKRKRSSVRVAAFVLCMTDVTGLAEQSSQVTRRGIIASIPDAVVGDDDVVVNPTKSPKAIGGVSMSW